MRQEELPLQPLSAFLDPEAAVEVVVDHAAGLHEGVADGGADKGEPAAAQVLAHGLGFGAGHRQFLEGTGPAAGSFSRHHAVLIPFHFSIRQSIGFFQRFQFDGLLNA